MRIGTGISDAGMTLHIDERSFPVGFPGHIWQSFPHRAAFADNYAFLKTLHLPWLLRENSPLLFDTGLPLFRHSMFMSLLRNVPFCTDVDRIPTSPELARFMGQEIRFADHDTKVPTEGVPTRERAVINMSFGKDSLLTFAVAREIGLESVLVMTVDTDGPLEYAYKAELAGHFCREFGAEIETVENGTSHIHRPEYWGTPPTEWGFGHLLTEYCMYSLPFAFARGAGYVLLGNEKSCDDWYVNHDGFVAYPVFDQSSEWTLELANIARGLTASSVTVASLIEPLHDLAISRILHTRYPDVARYQMSCFPDENQFGKSSRWCGHCTKCARNFVFLRANGIDPKSVGFEVDMFEAGFIDYFPILHGTEKGIAVSGYDAAPCGRDEQLFALFLAHERGARGAAMDVFTAKFLVEAKSRRDELHERFLTVQPARTIPEPLLSRVHNLYAEALA